MIDLINMVDLTIIGQFYRLFLFSFLCLLDFVDVVDFVSHVNLIAFVNFVVSCPLIDQLIGSI